MLEEPLNIGRNEWSRLSRDLLHLVRNGWSDVVGELAAIVLVFSAPYGVSLSPPLIGGWEELPSFPQIFDFETIQTSASCKLQAAHAQ